MKAQDVILRPVITEQSMNVMDDKKYTFEVNTRANKTQVRQAVEELFDVQVKKVNVLNTAPKRKTMGMTMRQRHEGYTKKRRKAVVTLTESSNEIEIFGSEEDED